MDAQRLWLRVMITMAFTFAITGLSACASLDKMAHDQDVYNQNRCQQFGLTPGSPQYVQCVVHRRRSA